MKKSKLARARTAMHAARSCENQARENYRRIKDELGAMNHQRNELLAALVSAVKTSDALNPERDYCQEWQHELRKMRAVIAKVSGGESCR